MKTAEMKQVKQSKARSIHFKKVSMYIDQNLDTKLTLDELCKVECISKYHFHRLFHLYFGLPVFKYIQLQRMRKAASQVYYHDHLSITTIAFDAGFENVESFSRAFKRMFLTSPSEFKKAPNWEPLNKVLKNNVNDELKGELIMVHQLNVNVSWFNKTRIAVLQHKGSPENLPRTIKQFIEWRKQHHTPPSSSKTFNILYDDPRTTPADDYRFAIATNINSDVKANTQSVTTSEIPEGYCAVLRHVGGDEHLGVLIDKLYTQWLPNSNYSLRDFPCFIERVTMFPTVKINEAITDIYLPVQANQPIQKTL